MLPEALALKDEELVPIKVDIRGAIMTVIGAVDRVQHLLPAMQDLPGSPAETVEKLPDQLRALGTAQARYAAVTAPPADLPKLLEEVTHWRDVLVAEEKALVVRGVLKEDALEQLTGLAGYKNVSFDVMTVAQVLSAEYAAIEPYTRVTREELVAADKAAWELVQAAGTREKPSESVAAEADVRQRMFSLVHGSYDQLRRAVSFLRWQEGDTDELVPSLYSGRKRLRADPSGEDASTEDEGAGAALGGGQGGEATLGAGEGSGIGATTGVGATTGGSTVALPVAGIRAVGGNAASAGAPAGGPMMVGLPGSRPLQ